MPSLDDITKFLEELSKFLAEFGLTKGLFVLFFIGAHVAIYRLYLGRLKDRQKQIDSLAKDNHEYRDRFLQLLDKHFFGPQPPSPKEAKRLQNNGG